MTRRGVTVAELIVALLVGALVGTAGVRGLLGVRRLEEQVTRRADAQANLRVAAAVLSARLRELAAGSPPGGDLLAITPTSFEHRAVRALYVLCRPPAAGQLVLRDPPLLGRRWFDPAEYGLLAWADSAGVWVALEPAGLSPAASCADGAPARAVQVVPADWGLARALAVGAPVRAVRRWELRRYRGGDGQWWLGGREWVRGLGVWATTQPVAGPLTGPGVRFTWLTGAGVETTDPAQVRRVLVVLEMDGVPLAFAVTLRNGVR